ncbi:MAG: 3-hydroxybutyryl-CoA dehydrogenase [Ardenticatenaceae bacterium]|nr:3-hydroxybutyryl-CoA dehydrogenase [Anaerolineales bacterium]MCB8923260.1 3-hydroxybutyryl-CoA dehydrogenase [Ardenticatenaceae bacterium]
MMRTIAVIGTGTMGRGIAQVSALGGYDVIVYDVFEQALANAVTLIEASIDKGVMRGKLDAQAANLAKNRFHVTHSLDDMAQADLIIEAIPEDLKLKHDLFSRLDTVAPKHTILASNTSSLSINSLAGSTHRGDRFLGLHFFNPPHIMKLVEVITCDDTSAETVTAAKEYVERIGKTAVFCKDTPAFIVNRVARPFYGEAFRMLGEGMADVATIDRLIKSIGFPMGPFELIDLIGCDVNLSVTQSVYDAYFQEPKYRPHPIQRRMVESCRLGRKTGRGFYDYHK